MDNRDEAQAERDERKAYKAAQKRAVADEAERVEFVRACLGIPAGRKFFYHLLGHSGLNANPFTTNALTTAFKCGTVNEGQYLQGLLIAASPSLYLEMLKEQENVRTNGSAEPSDADSGASED